METIMAIKTAHPIKEKNSASSPKAYLRRPPKPVRLRPFSALSLGQCWPRHWPGQPGPVVAQPKAVLGPPGPELGEPLGIHHAAQLIGCSPWTVRQTLIPRGLPHFRFKASGRLIFYRDQIIRWIESQQ